jgi:ribosomal protein S18 acetylase RimI-like enzyme
MKECSLEDLEKIKMVSEKTFYETFSNENSKEDMENYLNENFSYKQLENEIKTNGSLFYIVENNDKVVAYMKLNFDTAQTESGHNNTLEVQRIYVLKEYKNNHIGKQLIQKAIEIGKTNYLTYIWLGVWENNINAIKFYEKQGFETFDTHIFKLGEDEQTDNLMRLLL